MILQRPSSIGEKNEGELDENEEGEKGKYLNLRKNWKRLEKYEIIYRETGSRSGISWNEE